MNAYALDVFARRPYLNMTFRGFRRGAGTLGTRPACARIADNSGDESAFVVRRRGFHRRYRALKLGKVVGQPTAGWIIYTGGASLHRRFSPSHAVHQGHDRGRRQHGAKSPACGYRVDRPHGESYAGRDTQLDTAVRELLKQIDTGNACTARRLRRALKIWIYFIGKPRDACQRDRGGVSEAHRPLRRLRDARDTAGAIRPLGEASRPRPRCFSTRREGADSAAVHRVIARSRDGGPRPGVRRRRRDGLPPDWRAGRTCCFRFRR